MQLWIDTACAHCAERLLPIDLPVAVRAGELIAGARAVGARVDSEDAIIAATAQLRGFVVLTANTRHFAPMSVAHSNPFRALPGAS